MLSVGRMYIDSFCLYQAILNSQKTSVPGDLIAVPGATEKISFATFCMLLTYTPLLLLKIIILVLFIWQSLMDVFLLF